MTALGTTDAGDALSLDLDRLIGTHACIVANSGGGKSGLIRRLLEVTHGRVQHIVLDIEDEFYTLREHFDYVIAGGDGGDAPATVESAAGLARAALTHGFSLIVQMNDLGPDGAREFVGNFLESMISAPRELWHPVLVVLDEAQRFAPQDGSTEATAGVRALISQGRKRGFTAILASQRIAKIDADARGDINNWLLGRVGQSLDRKTMADALGFSPSSKEARGLQGLQDRHFWGFGPALSREPVLFRVADVETTPVRPGQAKVATPPAPEALRAILQGLANVEAPSDAKEPPSEMTSTELSDLRGQLAAYAQDRDAWMRIAETRRVLIERARAALQADGDDFPASAGSGGRDDVDRSAARAPVEPETPAARSAGRAEAPTPPRRSTALADKPSPAAIAIADLLDRINPARVTWSQAAAMTGRKASGGNFNSARKWLRASGNIVEDGDFIRSSAEAPAGMKRGEAIELWKSVLSNPAPRMIDALSASPLHPHELAECLGVQPRGGNWNNGLAQLRRNGVAEQVGGEWSLCRPLPGESA